MGNDYSATIARIKKVTGTRTQVELASLLGIKQSSISDAKRRNVIPPEWRMKLFEKLGVNPTWILTGKGPAYLRTEEGYVARDTRTPPDPAFLSVPDARPRNMPVFGMGLDMSGRPERVGNISLASSYARPGIFIVRCDVQVFAPTVLHGAYVGIDEKDKRPISGDMFAIRDRFGHIMFRRIYYDGNRIRFLLRSEDPACPEMELRPEDLAKDLVGKVAWVLQSL